MKLAAAVTAGIAVGAVGMEVEVGGGVEMVVVEEVEGMVEVEAGVDRGLD